MLDFKSWLNQSAAIQMIYSPFLSFLICKINFFLTFFFNKFILFIYFWLGWVLVAVRRLSLVAASGG